MMRRTEDVLRENAVAAEESSKRKKKKKNQMVAYGENGRRIRGKMKRWKMAILVIVLVFTTAGAAIYVPPALYQDTSDDSYLELAADATALRTYQQFVKDNPDADFDGDGLLNSEEDEHGTDIWSVDTDNDGVFDSAELTITNTSPTSASAIQVEMVQAEDNETGSSLSTPYKVDDIIFWPDDYRSKAYGAVVRTMHGYRFWNYSGYVKFPTRVYAYEYVDGVHRALPYREAEDAYRIDTSNEVRIYDEPLTFTNRLTIPFAGDIYLADGGFGDILSDVLPDKGGPVTCQHMAVIDTEPDTSEGVSAPLELPFMDFSNLERFGENQNTLQDLSSVRKYLEAGYCVAASLYSNTTGETIAIIYGYDSDGNLLVADTNLQPAGKLTITECARKVMNEEGVIGQMSWFEFSGFGFSSYAYRDRINFFATTATSPDAGNGDAIEAETENEMEAESEMATETQAETETPQTQVTGTPDTTPTPETEPAATEVAADTTLPEQAETGTTAGTEGMNTQGTDAGTSGTQNSTGNSQTEAGAAQEPETEAGEGGSVITFSLE